MIIMRKLKEDDQVIVYEYIPQDKIEKGKGEITVNKLDSKVIDYKLSKVENEKGILVYRDKSFHAILNFIDGNKFPNEYIYAWY
ncbi:hypothetical protein PQ693_00015 [Staphylococcus aureus]|uniref:hypothetical protein n=1 Tax=Staphylococcus aureus TaxID=1280 RepID=UPI0028FF7B2C|nr:hypothetical protein [Staphylococcus aureus]MDU0635631.1 hypothetical protein [Staphylococcus aureus]MDU9342769.1 hypothetical protein [Staphylococcus aureus]MDU9347065.1 hypothetical protein [Staphylococcus aureus]MDU9358936.1 hypothetical protein [Staphylococcus aureus]MDU9370244.1 hypothetical protein [Staphylococcus aureus]